MLVPLAVAGVEAGRVDAELDPAQTVLPDLEPAVEVVEATLDGGQAPEVADAELGVGALRIELPGRPGALGGGHGVSLR
jgi:hypothetical protein